jgi:hypothetical protein
MSLPMYPGLSKAEQNAVGFALRDAMAFRI